MKKRIRSLVSALAAIAVLVLLPAGNVLPVKAAEPVTYSLRYIGGDLNQWRFVYGSTFDTTQTHMSAAILPSQLKDGDSIVIYAEEGDVVPYQPLNLEAVKLESLTIYKNATAVVHTGGVNNCYILANSTSAINGDVTNAYIYDKVNCSFHNNVGEMTLYYTEVPYSNLTCGGTVNHFTAVLPDQENAKKYYDIYNVSAGALKLESGYLITKAEQYSTTPVVQSTPAADPAPANDSSEYDSVPKTGESSVYLLLLCASAVCFSGSLILRRRS